MTTTRVLHLVDRVTGGVPVAVRTYIGNSPGGVAHTIASPFADEAPAHVWAGLDADVAHVAWDVRTPAHAIGAIRRLARSVDADVVHAHSSFPGTYARLALRPGSTRLVYTPHCFAFERRDIGGAARAAYRGVEAALAARTDVLAACGPGEARAAHALRGRPRSVLTVPNVASLPPTTATRPREDGPLRVGMMGRWSPQKDPGYFSALVERLARAIGPVDATWIGGPADSASAAVRATGWLGATDVASELSSLDLYVHTAAWEGFPIALLDAHASGLPILARRIAALPDLPGHITTDEGVDGLIAALAGGSFETWRARNVSAWSAHLSGNTPEAQRDALARAWATVPV